MDNTKQQHGMPENRYHKALRIIRKGNITGGVKSGINDFIEKFNFFNEQNNFKISMREPDFREYEGETISFPNDIIYVSSFSEKINSPRFIQMFLPYKSLYVFLDHLLGGNGFGEYKRDLSKLDISLLKRYFNFYNRSSVEIELLYEVVLDIKRAFPLKQLFRGLNLIIVYIPVFLFGEPFTEAIIRINLNVLEGIIFGNRVSRKRKDGESSNNALQIVSIERMATEKELDVIAKKIIEQI